MSHIILRLPCIPFKTNSFSRHMPDYSRLPQCITQANYLTSGDNPAPTAHDWRSWNVRLYSGLLCNHWCKNHTKKFQSCSQRQIKSIHGTDTTLCWCNRNELKLRSRNLVDLLQVWNICCALLHALCFESNRANIRSDREVTEEYVSHDMRLWQWTLLSHKGHVVRTCSPGHHWSKTHLNSKMSSSGILKTFSFPVKLPCIKIPPSLYSTVTISLYSNTCPFYFS